MIVLNNIALFNGHADHFCGDACVVFADGHIVYAGPRDGSPALDGDAQVIDGRGHFVMPGMVELLSMPLDWRATILHQG